MSIPIEPLLFVLLLAMAVVIARMRDLLGAAMLFSIFSLLSAGLFTLMDAVDVAFTEAAVGAGVSTVLMLGTLALTANEEDQQPFRITPLIVVGLTGAILLYGTVDMPHYGDPDAVIHHHVAPEYITGTHENVHIPNVVTAVLGSYRGFDTYGEVNVVFAAGIGVLLLLSGRRRRPTPEAEEAPR